MQWLQAINDLQLPPLVSGSHPDPATGLCAMEMVAFMERLPHSDRPECTCPVLREITIATNDMLGHEDRQQLLPMLPELVDTNVPAPIRHERERFIMETARRTVEHHLGMRGGDPRYDPYRDRFAYERYRGAYRGREFEEAMHCLHKGPGHAMRAVFLVTPDWQRADVMIGMIRKAIAIGQPQPKREFNKPTTVKKLAEVVPLHNLPRKDEMHHPGKMMMMSMPVGASLVKEEYMAIDWAAKDIA